MEKNINISTCCQGRDTRHLAKLLASTVMPIIGSSPYLDMEDKKYHYEEPPQSTKESNRLITAAEEKRKRKAAKRLALSGKLVLCENCNEIMTEAMWVDIIKVDDNYYAECLTCPIDKSDELHIVNLDPFFDYCCKKYNTDHALSIMSDYGEFPEDMSEIIKDLPYGIEQCGCHCLKCDAIQ